MEVIQTNIVTHTIDLNVSQPNNFEYVYTTQGDYGSDKIIANLYDQNVPYEIDCDMIFLQGVTQYGDLIEINKGLEISKDRHSVTFTLTKDMLSSAGDIQYTLSFIDNTGRCKKTTFPFTIKNTIEPSGTISSSTLTAITDYVLEAKQYAEDAKQSYDDLVSEKGKMNGIASLDENGKVPSSQLPSFVDDVIEGYLSGGKFYKESAHTTEISGESGKIYIDLSTEKTYRWSGSTFVVISETLALGETYSTAYRGDKGKIAYDHSKSIHARTDATKVEKSSTNGNIKINDTETTVYIHPSGTNPHGTTKSDVGLGDVGNFKAVSTVANQGLTDAEKSNARTNIGAGTSSFSGSYNDLTDKPTIPTNNNQLTNGAGYITSSGTAKTISDTLPISKGGTGKTDGADAANVLINSLSVGTSTPIDADYYISQYSGGGTTTTTYHRRPMSALWNYIKSKLANVATSGNYNDLSNKPTIPTKVGELTNDKDYATKTEVTNAIDDIEIGGRNLLIGTKDFSSYWFNNEKWSVSSETYKGFTVMQRQFRWSGLYQLVEGDFGEVYTFSGYVKKTGGNVFVFTDGYGGQSTNHGAQIATKINEWEHFSVTSTVSTSGALGFRVENELNNETTYICGLKLEKGNKATDWTPAPEDVDNPIKAVRKETTVNLLKPALETTTRNGVTCTNNGDGTYTLDTGGSESSDTVNLFICGKYDSKEKVINITGKLKFVFSNVGVDNVSGQLLYNNELLGGGTNGFIINVSDSRPITLVNLQIIKGTILDNVLIKPMITTNLNATYDDFVPYTGSTGKLNSDVAEVRKDFDKHTHTKSQITDFPSSMPASDVYAWAKASSKPSYTKSEVGLGNVDNTADSAKSVKYATSAGSANSAARLNTSAVGSATQPVYFTDGKPVACTYTLGKSVPSDAKFTDTTYNEATKEHNGLMSAEDKTVIENFKSGGVTGVKGANETSYRSGNVSLSVDDIGAAAKEQIGDHTVKTNVPENAVFTDTTYDVVTETANGLMSSTDKKNLEDLLDPYNRNILANNTDLDTLITPMETYLPYQNTYPNIPSGVSNGLLKVIARSSTVKQILRRHGTVGTNDHEIYIRSYNPSTKVWSDWVRILTTKDNYAGSSSAGGSATSAVKLDSSAGSATQPVYFSGGKPTPCNVTDTYTDSSKGGYLFTAGGAYSLYGKRAQLVKYSNKSTASYALNTSYKYLLIGTSLISGRQERAAEVISYDSTKSKWVETNVAEVSCPASISGNTLTCTYNSSSSGYFVESFALIRFY